METQHSWGKRGKQNNGKSDGRRGEGGARDRCEECTSRGVARECEKRGAGFTGKPSVSIRANPWRAALGRRVDPEFLRNRTGSHFPMEASCSTVGRTQNPNGVGRNGAPT